MIEVSGLTVDYILDRGNVRAVDDVRHQPAGAPEPEPACGVLEEPASNAPAAYVLTYWFYLRHHGRHVKPGAGQHPGQLFPVQSGSGPPAEIDPGEHAPSLGSRPARPRTRPYREQFRPGPLPARATRTRMAFQVSRGVILKSS